MHPLSYEQVSTPYCSDMKSITLFDLVYNVYSNLGCLNVLKVKILDELSKNFGNNELSYVSSFLSMSGNSNFLWKSKIIEEYIYK